MLSNNKWRNTLKYSKILSLAACLGVAFLLLSGSALAGVTTGHSPLPKYAIQAGGINQVYTLKTSPQPATFTRQIEAARAVHGNVNSDFLVRIDLQTGFVFAAGGLPGAGDVTLTATGCTGAMTASVYDGGLAGDPYVRYLITVTTAFTGGCSTSSGWPYLTFTPNPWNIKDVNGYLTGTKNIVKYMYVTITTFDATSGIQFDDSFTETGDTANIIQTANGVEAGVATEGGKIIDLANSRKNFTVRPPLLPPSPSADRTMTDTTPRLDLQPAANVLGLDGNLFSFAGPGGVTINFTLTFTTNMTGIYNFVWDPNSGNVFPAIVATPNTLNIPGSNTGFGGSVPLYINVDGITSLDSRILNVTITYVPTHNAIGDTALAATPLTEWDYNGTLLISNYANGNTNAWRSRFYFWNYDEDSSSILVRLFTLPTDGTQSQLVGGSQLVFAYNIQANSGLTVKLEDILTQLGVALPYTAGGGNLYVEFSFGSGEVVGWTQTFDPTAANFMGTTYLHGTL